MDRLLFAEAEVVVVLPPGHSLATRETVDITDLHSERLVALRPSTLLRTQIDIAAAQAGVSINPVIETASGVIARVMQAIADATSRLGGPFVKLDSSWRAALS